MRKRISLCWLLFLKSSGMMTELIFSSWNLLTICELLAYLTMDMRFKVLYRETGLVYFWWSGRNLPWLLLLILILDLNLWWGLISEDYSLPNTYILCRFETVELMLLGTEDVIFIYTIYVIIYDKLCFYFVIYSRNVINILRIYYSLFAITPLSISVVIYTKIKYCRFIRKIEIHKKIKIFECDIIV